MKKNAKFCSIYKITLMLLLLALSSCLSRVEKHGFMFEISDYQLVEEGISSKQNVLIAMGTPTITSFLDSSEVWIYYSEDVRKLLFFKPDVIERKIMVLEFDKTDIVKLIRNFDISDEKNMSFASNYTEVDSIKVGFFKSLFSNIGQVKPQ